MSAARTARGFHANILSRRTPPARPDHAAAQLHAHKSAALAATFAQFSVPDNSSKEFRSSPQALLLRAAVHPAARPLGTRAQARTPGQTTDSAQASLPDRVARAARNTPPSPRPLDPA